VSGVKGISPTWNWHTYTTMNPLHYSYDIFFGEQLGATKNKRKRAFEYLVCEEKTHLLVYQTSTPKE
jgi:hypothetical protein